MQRERYFPVNCHLIDWRILCTFDPVFRNTVTARLCNHFRVVRIQENIAHGFIEIFFILAACGFLNAVSIVGTLGHKVPDSRSGLTGELLMRTNKELTIGNFELDHDTGTVLFRTTNIFPVEKVDGNIIASLVHTTLAEVDRLTPFLTLLLRMDQRELAGLNLKTFLMREDLLPPVPDEESPAP